MTDSIFISQIQCVVKKKEKNKDVRGVLESERQNCTIHARTLISHPDISLCHQNSKKNQIGVYVIFLFWVGE